MYDEDIMGFGARRGLGRGFNGTGLTGLIHFWGIDMLEIFTPSEDRAGHLGASLLGSHICCICTVYGQSTPFAGTYYDRPVYSHHRSPDMGLKGWFQDVD